MSRLAYREVFEMEVEVGVAKPMEDQGKPAAAAVKRNRNATEHASIAPQLTSL